MMARILATGRHVTPDYVVDALNNPGHPFRSVSLIEYPGVHRVTLDELLGAHDEAPTLIEFRHPRPQLNTPLGEQQGLSVQPTETIFLKRGPFGWRYSRGGDDGLQR